MNKITINENLIKKDFQKYNSVICKIILENKIINNDEENFYYYYGLLLNKDLCDGSSIEYIIYIYKLIDENEKYNFLKYLDIVYFISNISIELYDKNKQLINKIIGFNKNIVIELQKKINYILEKPNNSSITI